MTAYTCPLRNEGDLASWTAYGAGVEIEVERVFGEVRPVVDRRDLGNDFHPLLGERLPQRPTAIGPQLVAGVLLLALTPLLLAREHMVRPRWGVRELRALTAVGLPVAISTVLGVVYLRMLVVLMSLVSGSEREIGYYVTSTRIVELFVGLPFLLITVSLPVMTLAARDDEGRVNYVTARTTEILAIGGVLIALVLAIAADPLVLLLGGDQYGPAGDVLRIQAFVLPFVFLAAAWTPTLLGMGRAGVLVAASSVGAITLLGAGLVLIPELGAEGAAAAAVAGDVTVCLVTYVLLRAGGPRSQHLADRTRTDSAGRDPRSGHRAGGRGSRRRRRGAGSGRVRGRRAGAACRARGDPGRRSRPRGARVPPLGSTRCPRPTGLDALSCAPPNATASVTR